MNKVNKNLVDILRIPKLKITIEGDVAEIKTKVHEGQSIVFFISNVINIEKETPDVDVQMGVIGDSRLNTVIFSSMPNFVRRYLTKEARKLEKSKKQG